MFIKLKGSGSISGQGAIRVLNVEEPPSPPVPFTPESLAGLFLWIDFRDDETLGTTSAGLGAVVVSDPVGYAEDVRDGITRHVKQAVSLSRPIYRGADGVEFDGSNDSLDSPPFSDLDTRARVYFQVLDVPVNPGVSIPITESYATGAAGASDIMAGIVLTSEDIRFQARNNSGTVFAASLARANVAERIAVIGEWLSDGTVRCTAQTIANTTTITGADATPSGHISTLIGRHRTFFYLKSHVLMHGTILGEITAEERAELMDYLNAVAP